VAVQTMTPTSGTDGRVQTTTGTQIAGISSWRRSSKTNVIPIPHFESPANADGLVQPRKLRGLGDGGTIAFEGIVNLTTAGTGGTHTVMENGLYVSLDLLISRTAALGYPDVVGWISDFQVGSKISNEAATFSATLEVDGVFPAYGTV
jgi:hypothetical protein